MSASPVIFCERTGYWAAAARRVWSRRAASRPPVRTTTRVIETRSAAECREMVAAHRGSFVVVELEAPRLESALDMLFDLGVRFSGTASAVVAGRPLQRYESLARELGALAFVVSPLQLDVLCNLADRLAARTVSEPLDVQQHIWENLPWK